MSDPKHILLTGATGFVGAFLLHDLLTQTSADVHCLLRADDLEMGVQRLKRNLNNYSLWDDSFAERIKPVLGYDFCVFYNRPADTADKRSNWTAPPV